MDGLPPQHILIFNRVMGSLTGEVREYYHSSNKIKIYHQLWRAGVFNLKHLKRQATVQSVFQQTTYRSSTYLLVDG